MLFSTPKIITYIGILRYKVKENHIRAKSFKAEEPQEKYMKEALKLAKKAADLGEVPIGCVIEFQGKIIARGYNRRRTDNSTLSHAELIAIKKASKKLNDWRLEGCTMYVTLEPCQMCAGAIVQARIPRVIIGSMNPKAGCAGSIMDILHEPRFNHQVLTQNGMLDDECSEILSSFFKKMRSKSKVVNQTEQ